MRKDGYDIGQYSILGDRKSQQDTAIFEWNGPLLLAAVCDGMGGLEGGEYASRTGITVLAERMRCLPPDGIDSAAGWIRNALIEADGKVAALTNEWGERMNAGSTAVAAVMKENQMQWGSVGDSSIYMMREGHLEQLTRMHNYHLRLAEMLRSGEIDEQERDRQSMKGEALISYLGIGGLPLVDTTRQPITLQEEDIILLCSDGLYKTLDTEQIRVIIEESGGNMELAAERLCKEAYRLAIRKQDNTTVIVIRYMGEKQ